MRYLVFVVFLIVLFILICFYILAFHHLHIGAIKDDILSLFPYPEDGVLSEEWEIVGDEETGLSHIHEECTTWATMGTFLMATASDSNTMAKTVNQQVQEIMDHYHGFMLEIKTVLDDFQVKTEGEAKSQAIQVVRDDKETLECTQFLNEVFETIQHKIRYIGINIMSSTRSYVHKLHDQISAMIQGLYEKIIRDAEPINIRECTCDLLIRVNELQKNSLPKVRNCVESYAVHSIRALNETAYELLYASQQSINTIDQTKQTKNQSNNTLLLSAEVSRFKGELRKIRNEALNHVDNASNEFNSCQNHAADETEYTSMHIFKNLIECFEFIDIFSIGEDGYIDVSYK